MPANAQQVNSWRYILGHGFIPTVYIDLNTVECVPAIGVELHRMLLIRFSMIHFWSSLRSFVLITTFGSDESQFSYDDCSAMELLRCMIIVSLLRLVLNLYHLTVVYEEEPGARTLYKLLCFRLVESYVMKSVR